MPDGPPPRLVAEVFEGGDCGFGCRPMGARVYCADLSPGEAGSAPEDLVQGQRYCFMGTAIDAEGQAYAANCGVFEAGAGPIEITLSAIEEGRVIARQCEETPVVRLDAGARDAGSMDASAPVDAGGPRDAGPPIDAGPPRTDAGLPFGTPVSVDFIPSGPGGLYLTEEGSGTPLGSQPLRAPVQRTLDGYVGLTVRMEAVPDGGSSFVRFEGGGCGTSPLCIFTLSRSETVRAIFE